MNGSTALATSIQEVNGVSTKKENVAALNKMQGPDPDFLAYLMGQHVQSFMP